MAYENKEIELQSKIRVRYNGKLLNTTVGRLVFNEALPKEIKDGYPDGIINEMVGKKVLGRIVEQCYRKLGNEATAVMLDEIKKLGFAYATQAGITVGISDIQVPSRKAAILEAAGAEVDKIEQQFRRGLITEDERYQGIIAIWNKATEDVTEALLESLEKFNPVYMMANSGARGNVQQIRQLAGMRGLMADPSGRIIDLPIKANFREGLTVLEYFISTHGARKGLADTALRTADSAILPAG